MRKNSVGMQDARDLSIGARARDMRSGGMVREGIEAEIRTF